LPCCRQLRLPVRDKYQLVATGSKASIVPGTSSATLTTRRLDVGQLDDVATRSRKWHGVPEYTWSSIHVGEATNFVIELRASDDDVLAGTRRYMHNPSAHRATVHVKQDRPV
jgi:hypothetical protein